MFIYSSGIKKCDQRNNCIIWASVNTYGIYFGTMGLTHTEQLRAARSMIGWTQAQLAGQAGVSLPTIKRLEVGTGRLGVRLDTLEKIRSALENGGVEFIPENGGGPGVRPEGGTFVGVAPRRASRDALALNL